MAITTKDGFYAAIAGSTPTPVYKASITAVAGFFYNLFRAAAGIGVVDLGRAVVIDVQRVDHTDRDRRGLSRV